MRIITINDNGTISVPINVQMRDYEIANLLGVMTPAVRGAIKRLLKSRMGLDCNGGIVSGHSLIPEYFGLDVVIAIAFQVNSYQAEILRDYMLSRLTTRSRQPIYVQIGNDSMVDNYS